ncbi:OpgC domain-containing protein [Candidatus Saccharibacteria bacterium]|nr:OpgC domain-containing protein [Candidatus Saccharibacteria bacterium]
MKNASQRVIAIDYFRGICLLMVVINHSWLFSMPYAYLTGAGGMWTSAAELFFLLSGVTMMIVRGRNIKTDFSQTVKKIWKRAGLIYAIYITLAVISLCLMYILPSDVSSTTIGPTPSAHGASLLWQILSFQYSTGLASFLMYYSVYLLATPFILRVMQNKAYPFMLITSLGAYILASSQVIDSTLINGFLAWQLYYILGMALGRFRVSIISRFYALPRSLKKRLSTAIFVTTGLAITTGSLLAFNLYQHVDALTTDGWLPVKLRAAYLQLLNHGSFINDLFRDDRLGLLRPLASLLFLAAGYLLYQRYKHVLLPKTGKFVNAMGKDTLWIFSAQALVIPILAALPVSRGLFMNTIMTAFVILLLASITQRKRFVTYAVYYIEDLRLSYSQAKYNYIQRYEDS